MSTSETIWIIDDDPFHQQLLVDAIGAHGYATEIMNDGDYFFENFNRLASTPSLILLDMCLPGVSGHQVLHRVRETYNQNEVPVIIFSAVEQDQHVMEGIESGANDYVFKNTPLPVLLTRIDGQMAARRNYMDTLEHTRHQVMRESLGAACHNIAQPITAATMAMDILLDSQTVKSSPLHSLLHEVKGWIDQSGRQIHQLQTLDEYRRVEYVKGTHIIDIDAGAAPALPHQA